jgi:molybdate transport system regulatory protein
MNRLPGRIVGVESDDGIMLIDVEAAGVGLTALLLGAGQLRPLAAGDVVELAFQEAEVSLARNRSGTISLRNVLPCVVAEVKTGRLLTHVALDFAGHRLAAIITTRSARHLELAPGVEVEALIKANEMSLA